MAIRLIYQGPKNEPIARGSIDRIEFLAKNSFSADGYIQMKTDHVQIQPGGVNPIGKREDDQTLSPWLENRDGTWKDLGRNSRFFIPAKNSVKCALRVGVREDARTGDYSIDLPFQYTINGWDPGISPGGSFQVIKPDAEAP